MFGNKEEIRWLQGEISELKRQVYGEKKELDENLDNEDSDGVIIGHTHRRLFDLPIHWSVFGPKTLKNRVDSIAKRIDEVVEQEQRKFSVLQDKFNALLKHMNIEYHKITDENGHKVVKEVYKKRPKQKKAKRSYDDDDDLWSD